MVKWEFSGAEVGDLFLKVKADSQDLILKCFISGDTLYDLAINHLYKAGDFLYVRFNISNYYKLPTRSNNTKSVVLDPDGKEGSNRYIIQGQVIKVYPDESSFTLQDHQRLIIDCGIAIYTRVPISYPVKVGDYLRMSDRLDAHIVGKAE